MMICRRFDRLLSLRACCVIAAIAIFLVLATGSAAFADCKEEVNHLRQEINDNRDNYTADSRAEAKKELAMAQATLLQPLECREHLRNARQALQKK